MLVSLGQNVAIGTSATVVFTYSPQSVQKVFLRFHDADWEATRVKVQIGSKVICNGVSAHGLLGLSNLQNNNNSSATAAMLTMDFGSHICQAQDNLYVSVTAVAAITAVDCSAIVDTPKVGVPLKLTEYSDNVFTSTNNLLGLCYRADEGDVFEDDYPVTVQTAINSSSPSFISTSSYYEDNCYSIYKYSNFGLINKHQFPLATTYNYSTAAATDRILTVEQMPVSKRQLAMQSRAIKLARSQAGR